MTLIEILIVLAILGMMTAAVVGGFGSTRSAEVTRAVDQVAIVIRHGYDKARVTGGYYRLWMNLDDQTVALQEGDDRMLLPATDRDGEILEFDPDKEEDRARRDKQAADAFNRSLQAQVFADDDVDAGEAPESDVFSAAPREVPRRKPPLFDGFEDENSLSGLSKPFQLPEGLKIKSVRTADDLKPIEAGEASIYFFPRGYTQKAHILLEDEARESRWTIKVQPLTGRVTIAEGHEELVLPDDPNDAEDDLGQRRGRRTL